MNSNDAKPATCYFTSANSPLIMNPTLDAPAASLPATLEQLLTDLTQAARDCFKDDLRSLVLFGNGAKGRLRPTSDLNLLFILKRYT